MPSDRETLNKLRGKRLEQQIIAMVNEEKRYSEAEFSAYYRKCKLWYDLYRGVWMQNYHGFRNSISIPFLYSVVQSDVARKVQMSFGNFPYVGFEGFSQEDAAVAKKNEILVGVQMEDANLYRKAVDFFVTADLYGVGITRDGWRQDLRKEKIRIPTYLPNRQTLETEKEVWMSYFDGPDVEVLDPLDCFPEPGYRFIEDMLQFTYRYYRDLDDLRDQVRAEIADGMDPSFDMDALNEVERTGMTGDMESSMYERQGYARNANAFANRFQRFNKPVEIWERWGLVPADYAPDGRRHRRIVIFNGKILGRNVPNPYHHGQKPFSSYSVGDPHYFHGIGKTELLSKLQAASNRIMNHKLDSLDMSISPAIIVGANSGLDSSRPLHMTPGKIIQLDTLTVGEDVIRPFTPNLQGIQAANVEIQTLWQYMQQGSGIIEDVVSGATPSREQTAREYQGRQEAVMTRLMLESRIAEESWLEPLANRFRALNRQYLSIPKQVNRIGTMAVTDPITGQPLDDSIDYADLWPDYKARAVGANQNMLRSAQRQDIIQILQAAGSNPALMQQVNWGNFARQMFSTFGFRNINELLVQMQPGLADTMQQLMMVGGREPASGQGGPGAPGAAIGAPENLSPASTPRYS